MRKPDEQVAALHAKGMRDKEIAEVLGVNPMTVFRSRKRQGLSPNYTGPTHGKIGTYTSLGCRCDKCRAAGTERARRQRAERAKRITADPSLAPHGKVSTYGNWGCRCRPCRDANSARMREYWQKRGRAPRGGAA